MLGMLIMTQNTPHIVVLQIVYFLLSMPVVYRPRPLADATAHAQARCWKGSSSHETAMPQSVAILQCPHVENRTWPIRLQ